MTISIEMLEEIYSKTFDKNDRRDVGSATADEPDDLAHRAALVAVAEAVLESALDDEASICCSPEELRRLQGEMNRRMSAMLNALKG